MKVGEGVPADGFHADRRRAQDTREGTDRQAIRNTRPVQELVVSVVESLREQAAEGTGRLPKGNIRDSVFTDLFRIPEYAYELYRSLHPEDTATVQSEVRSVTLANVLLNQQYNDLALVVSSRLLILVEHQSTWTSNIIVRIFIYYAMILNGYIIETGQSVYTTRKLDFPRPEFYVVYTGPRKERPGVVRLTEEFFGGAGSDLEVRVHMLYGGRDGDILDQFMGFSDVYAEQFRLHGRSKETIRETIRTCMEKGILCSYLESRRKEVEDIMTSLLNEKVIMDAYTHEVRNEGREEGREEGLARGIVEMGREFGLEDDQIIKKLSQKLGIIQEAAEEYLRMFSGQAAMR